MELRKNKKGLTLLELMIACGILIVALTSLLGTYVACFELIESTKNANLASTAVLDMMEEIRGTPSESFQTIAVNYDNQSYGISGMPSSEGRLYVVVDDTNSTLLNITIGACWRQRGNRIIGECVDSGGNLTFSDSDFDGILDSPVQLSTLMAQR